MILTEQIAAKRINLRCLDTTDATDAYAGWLNDPDVHRYLTTKHATVPELQAYIQAKNELPDALLFGIFLRDTGDHIGTVKLEPIDPEQGQATIAIMIGDKSSWGLGLGGEVIETLREFACEKLGLHTIDLGVHSGNLAAIRSYAKLGFQEFRRDIGAFQEADKSYDHVYMMKRCVHKNNSQV